MNASNAIGIHSAWRMPTGNCPSLPHRICPQKTAAHLKHLRAEVEHWLEDGVVAAFATEPALATALLSVSAQDKLAALRNRASPAKQRLLLEISAALASADHSVNRAVANSGRGITGWLLRAQVSLESIVNTIQCPLP